MCYAERGHPQEGIPTMVMLHGFSGSLDAAVPVIQVNTLVTALLKHLGDNSDHEQTTLPI